MSDVTDNRFYRTKEDSGISIGGETYTIEPFTGGMRQSPTIGKLAEALAKAQGEITGAKKGSKNPHFGSSYADLASSWAAARDALSKNGLAVAQVGAMVDGQYTIRTKLLHSSGEWLEGDVPCMVAQRASNPMQALGSAITYARRYGFQAITGIAPVDEDGNAAGAAPAKAWPTEEQAQAWKGPQNKTALTKRLRALAEDIKDCSDSGMIAALEHGYEADLAQAEDDLPEWFDRARVAIDAKRDELEAREAADMAPTPLDAG